MIKCVRCNRECVEEVIRQKRDGSKLIKATHNDGTYHLFHEWDNLEVPYLEEMTKRFGLSSVEVERMKSYMEKAEQSEIRYCPEHDREYFDFKFEGMCPMEYEEKLWWDCEHGDEKARQVLEKSGRFEGGGAGLDDI
jgi:hypothetical protein